MKIAKKEEGVIIVTGISGSIGHSICEQLVAEGFYLIGIDQVRPKHDFVDEFFRVDLSKISEVQNFCQKINEHKLKIKGIVFNAAMQLVRPCLETEIDEWDKVMMVNFSSSQILVRNLYKSFLHCSLVFISSVHARATSIGLGAYAVSKGALCSLSKVLSLELAGLGHRSNCILPGAIESEMLKSGLERSGDGAEARKNLIKGIPLKKIGEGSDIAKLCLFLLSDNLSGNITGQEFVCDGGVLALLASEVR